MMSFLISRAQNKGLALNVQKKLLIYVGTTLGSLFSLDSVLADKYFDPYAINLASLDQDLVDLEAFNQGKQLPGTYRVDVFLNDKYVDQRDVTFVRANDQLQPLLSVEDLKAMGVNTEAFPLFSSLEPDEPVISVAEFIPLANTHLDYNKLLLKISIPQAALAFSARNSIDPSTWDQGLPALMFNYTASGSNTWQRKGNGESHNGYLNLGSGLNAGAWRLRNTSTYTASRNSSTSRDEANQLVRRTEKQRQWESISTYAQRDVQRLRGQLTLGDSYTPGDVFDSVKFLGVQLASDDNMLPDSLRGYAPVIRGIANSNAQITVHQNGYTIYQTYVAPGAFTIRDIYPTSSSGNLDVTITEADGSERTFVQPFSAVPIMQREGGLKYSLTAGQYRTQTDGAQMPGFVQPSLIYGLSNSVTLYGGAQLSGHYHSGLLGIGHGLGRWGSVSVDAAQARTTLQDRTRHQGRSYRVQYGKDIFQSGTSFTLAGYRYSTSGFYDFQEANEMAADASRDDYPNAEFWRQGYNKRSKMQVRLSQSLGDAGSLYLNAYQQSFWKTGVKERTFSAGYSTTHRGVTYGVNVDATQYLESRTSKQVAFSVQIPLDKLFSKSWGSYGIQTDNSGHTRQQAGINGLLLDDENLSYAVQQTHGNHGAGHSGSSSLDYRGASGRVQGGYSYSDSSQRLNYGVQGGIVVHPYGVTVGQALGHTMALVRVPGASDVKVQNQIGVRTDSRGYALVPHVSTYRNNRVALDPTSLGNDMDIDTPVKTVIPTSGAVVLADFKARIGARALVTITHDNRPMPFGATATLVLDGTQVSSGIVADAGTVYLSGLPAAGQIIVKWKNGVDRQCRANYRIPEKVAGSKALPVVNIAATCH
jgi:outer membrane usher protein